MDLSEKYKRLNEIQDLVISTVSAIDTGFYLTGGTCLHRFYLQKRYSDDLDFFTSDTELYRENVRLTTEGLRKQVALTVIVDTRDFVRIVVGDALQVDFVNDRVPRHGTTTYTDGGIRIDNLLNIAANKICAIVGRDEPKDVFDLCSLLVLERVDPREVLAIAGEKCVFDRELFELRLRSFPPALLDDLAIIDDEHAVSLQKNYERIIEMITGI